MNKGRPIIINKGKTLPSFITMLSLITMLTLTTTLSLLFLLEGCVKIPDSTYPVKRYFTFDISREENISAPDNSRGKNIPAPHTASSASSALSLIIRKFRVSPRYEGKGFTYRRSELSYESDFYNEFFISPGSLIAEEVDRWLTAAGLFQYVTDFPIYLEPDYILEGEVTDLYGDYRTSKTPTAIMGIRFFLLQDQAGHTVQDRTGRAIQDRQHTIQDQTGHTIQYRADHPEMVFQKHYRKEVILKKNSPEALAMGWNKALQHILEEFEKDLSVLLTIPDSGALNNS